MLKDGQLFEWDVYKDLENQAKHGVSFEDAIHVFKDKNRIISSDPAHSADEHRQFCYGLDITGRNVLTVRFTYRSGRIRVIGAGYWRKGRKIYGQENKIHRRPDG